MGSLTLPSSGSIYLDLSRIEPSWNRCGCKAQAGQFEIVSSELVLLETLVKPLMGVSWHCIKVSDI